MWALKMQNHVQTYHFMIFETEVIQIQKGTVALSKKSQDMAWFIKKHPYSVVIFLNIFCGETPWHKTWTKIKFLLFLNFVLKPEIWHGKAPTKTFLFCFKQFSTSS